VRKQSSSSPFNFANRKLTQICRKNPSQVTAAANNGNVKFTFLLRVPIGMIYFEISNVSS